MNRTKNLFSIALLISVCALTSLGQAAAKPMLAVLNKQESTLSLIDPVTMKLVTKIPTGDAPHEVVFSTDGKTAYVANYGGQTPGNSLTIVDVATGKETKRADLLPFIRPHGVQFVGGKLYFTAESNRAIARFDPATSKVDWMMGTGQNASHMIAVSGDQKRIVTANIGSDSVTVFDFNAVPPAASKITQIAVGKQPEAVDLSPDGKEVWVGLNAEEKAEVVDVASAKSVAKIDIKGRPYRVRFTPDGKQVICTMIPTREIAFIDAATRKETGRMKVDGVPLGIAFSSDGKTAFVTLNDPDVVIKVDLEKREIKGRLETGKGPDGVAVFGQ